ncbi:MULTISPECIES: sporulation inhibitor of replication protein SirA [unclassified Sporolactobacillus]|uniref:sporulation inhibitor of replication protein SirA n=1 Tax=unclassified Sporolactobacillus TaxID=2628533 RepID=UPI002367C0A2|nr:sporulation inhibitor of replication protein SirA [Sporolactobacillus sp. CQH2019]MDD9149551.1 sporulation inhibitor of replication protein SirA [Sporolactobacillus sp. CQH2019]
MRSYHIYLIKDNIAKHYFGQEEKLFQLFKDFRSARDKHMKEVLYRQIRFVSHQLDAGKFKTLLQTACKLMTDYTYEDPIHYLKSKRPFSEATLELQGRELKMTSQGTSDMEVTFFEILRKLDGHFLAVNFQARQCAWLNPIKNADFLQSKVDLISRDSVH